MCFSFGALQLTTHTSIKAAKIVTLTPFPSSTNFDPDLRLTRINCFTVCFNKLHYNMCSANHETISCSKLVEMATSHMRSIASSVIKFIKTKLSFLASKFRLLFSNPQAAITHVDGSTESHSEHKSIEGMRTSCSPNINEVSVQVTYINKQYRSRYDIHVNLCQQNLRRRRSRAVSRIPTNQIKRLLQKSRKVVIKVQKHVRKVVLQSSKLHVP